MLLPDRTKAPQNSVLFAQTLHQESKCSQSSYPRESAECVKFVSLDQAFQWIKLFSGSSFSVDQAFQLIKLFSGSSFSVDQASAIAPASECVHAMTCSLGHMIRDSRATGCCNALHYIALVYSSFRLEIELVSGKFTRCGVDNQHPWVEHFCTGQLYPG